MARYSRSIAFYKISVPEIRNQGTQHDLNVGLPTFRKWNSGRWDWGVGNGEGVFAAMGAQKASQYTCGWRKIRYFVRHLYRLIGPLLDTNWQNCRAGAKTSRQPGHFHVSRVSCIGSRGWERGLCPCCHGRSGTFVHNRPQVVNRVWEQLTVYTVPEYESRLCIL